MVIILLLVNLEGDSIRNLSLKDIIETLNLLKFDFQLKKITNL